MKHDPNSSTCVCEPCIGDRCRELKLENEGHGIASKVADYVNAMSNPKYFVHGMASQHRTLQQFFTKLCVAWFEYLATSSRYDLRNEDSVRLAKAVVATEAWKDNNRLRYI